MNDKKHILQNSLSFKKIREERKKEITKDALFNCCKKNIQTTMIGALDAIEKNFGFLWGFEDAGSDLTEEQNFMKGLYNELRDKILDNGNTQIRNLESEFSFYEIDLKKHHINLPVITDNTKGEKNDG